MVEDNKDRGMGMDRYMGSPTDNTNKVDSNRKALYNMMALSKDISL